MLVASSSSAATLCLCVMALSERIAVMCDDCVLMVVVRMNAAGSLRCCGWQLKACAMMLSALFAEFS